MHQTFLYQLGVSNCTFFRNLLIYYFIIFNFVYDVLHMIESVSVIFSYIIWEIHLILKFYHSFSCFSQLLFIGMLVYIHFKILELLISIFSRHFTFSATTLTSWHLLVTFCSLHIALWMKWFEHKPFDPRAVMGFGILNGTSIGLLNLSLGFNSVGFYQVICT